jgi:hypothetical protein
MKKLFVVAIVCVAITAGCHAQIPPTSPKASLTVSNVDPSCTTAKPCVFAISRATIASGTTCPATNGTAYALVATTGDNVTTYLDASVTPGTSYCWIAQTQQSPQTSAPSTAVFLAVPNGLLAPGLNVTQASADRKPELSPAPEPTVASNHAPTLVPQLTVRLVR